MGDSPEKPIYIETLPRRGYRLIAPVTMPHDATPRERLIARETGSGIGKRARTRFERPIIAILGTATLLMTFVLGTGAVNFRGLLFGGNTAKPITSLAVLPLENLSADPDQEYFADGMTDELITDLAQLDKLRVISRTSVMHYKRTQKTLPQIARELNVDAVSEGTVARVSCRHERRYGGGLQGRRHSPASLRSSQVPPRKHCQRSTGSSAFPGEAQAAA
jgi:hypothetical protein